MIDRDSVKAIWYIMGVVTLVSLLGVTLIYGRREVKPWKPPDSRKVGVAIGKTTGKFVRGFLSGVKESK